MQDIAGFRLPPFVRAAICAALAGPVVAQQPPVWTNTGASGIAAHREHAAAFDLARSRMVVFGGAGPLADTWELQGTTWVRFQGAGPAPRAQTAMAFDSARGRTVLFGGAALVGALGDTWLWDGVVWQPTVLSPASPPARSGHAMAFDGRRGRVVMFGGSAVGGLRNDTWEWDGLAWTQAASTGPSPRALHAMAFDGARGRTVLFGGSSGTTRLGDTWEWDGASWSQVATNGPPAREAHAMAFDSIFQRTVLFGGEAAGGLLGDTWEWDGATWAQANATGPTARRGHAMVFDATRHRTVLACGDAGGSSLQDTWEWNSGSTSVAASFGAGCGSPALTLAPLTRPTIGQAAQVSIGNVPALPGQPSGLAFVALGFSDTAAGPFPLPLALAGFGMPGCSLLHSAEAAAEPAVPSGPSTATFTMALPFTPAFVGTHVFLQGWAFAPGQNAGHTIVSNGVRWEIGDN